MEIVLDGYKRPFDPRYPIVCMDESQKQLIAETKTPIQASPGHPTMHDYEYRRCSMCNTFIASEPLTRRVFLANCMNQRRMGVNSIGMPTFILPDMF